MKSVKIEIRNRWTGTVLFEYKSEGNTIKKTLIEARKQGADLQDADLRGADLQDADLQDADLQDADLRGADLRGADLRGADLQGADLRGADLRGADLQDADNKKIKIKKIAVFTGLYKYTIIVFLSARNERYIKMGCFLRKVKEWEKDFWNNDREFPDNDSEASKLRLMAYEAAKKWFDIIKK